MMKDHKQRNAQFGCPRIAQKINKAFGVSIDKDVGEVLVQKLVDCLATQRPFSKDVAPMTPLGREE